MAVPWLGFSEPRCANIPWNRLIRDFNKLIIIGMEKKITKASKQNHIHFFESDYVLHQDYLDSVTGGIMVHFVIMICHCGIAKKVYLG